MTVWTVMGGVLLALLIHDIINSLSALVINYFEDKKAQKYFEELMSQLEEDLTEIRKTNKVRNKPVKKAAVKKKATKKK